MKKIGRIYILSVLILACLSLNAQINFYAKAPVSVGVNEGFTLNLTINAGSPSHFQPPEVKGAKIVAGPSQSSSSSTTIINGKVSSSKSFTYSYTLVASKEGSVSISPAKITVNGQTYTSNPVKVQVTNNPVSTQRQNNTRNQPYYSSQPQTNTQNSSNGSDGISEQSLFVRAIPNKTDVVKGEEVIITYKLYTLYPVSEYQIERIPSSSGFWIEDPDNQTNPHLRTEVYNGRQYQVADLKKVILYPQKSGTLTIKPMSLTVTAHIATRSRQNVSTGDPFFDQFFNDPFFSSVRTSVRTVEKKLYTNAVTFNVKELPAKPDNYCGGVGGFSVKADTVTKKIKAFEPFYLTYTLSGSGNLTLINNLPLNLPDEFQLSDPEITDNITRSALGVSGSRAFRYLVIPQVEGDFVIPSLNTSYYDINKKEYVTLSTEQHKIHIDKGDVSEEYAVQLEDRAKYRNMNIKSGIKTSSLDREYHIFDNLFLYIIPLIFVLLTAIAVLLFARYRKMSADVVNMKMKRSTKVAVRRLKKAKRFLDKGETEKFEDETAIALWNYLSDRFKIDKTQLSVQACTEILNSAGIDSLTTDKLQETLNRCQYLRFSQDKTATADLSLYDDAIDVISSTEQQMKRLKKSKKEEKPTTGRTINIPTAMIWLFMLTFAALNSANASNTDATAYCAKADSCFKHSDYANAVLYYEKALKFSPSNKDIKLNINITKARLVGNTYVIPEFVLVRWVKNIASLLPSPVWAVMFTGLFLIACVMFFVYLFTADRKVLFFYLTTGFLILSLCSMALGTVRQNIQNDTSHAILMKSNIHLKQTRQQNAKDVQIMYKGQKVKLLDGGTKQWIKVRTEDHKEGYMENKNYKRI
ncbi:MAG: BatD family protein [Bacteroidales bacterium]|nr:BatD family protein [Bacteroidales bacterium]